jgi:tRNA A-37 threonylcarbamoyl transferase component Bud32
MGLAMAAAEIGEPEPELFVRLGVLTETKLQECLATQKGFRDQGVSLTLAQIILNLGAAPPEQVARVVAHQGTAVLRCPQCRRRFTVPDFQAQRRYKCEPCRAYLEIVAEEILGGGASPAPAEAATAPAAARKDPFEGRTIGTWRVVRRIAKGGMGAVYLGEHTQTGRKVAVKILTEEYSRMPGIQGRFKREADTTLRLQHPNIVETYEMGQDGPHTYIVSEYVEGGSLVDLIVREKKLPPRRAVEIVCDILSALDHAHGRGVVHRDVKPANVLLTADGRAKVIDFGLAKDAEANTILTLSGNVVGTPAYMAPEQAMGEPAGPLADLYSCGILLYLMLTGRKPFEGRSLVETLRKQIHDPLPPARPHNPEVPEALESVLRKICAKQPSQRYRTLPEAIAALRKAVGLPVGPEGSPPKAAGRPPLWIALWAAAAAAAAGGLAWLLLRS